MFFIATLVRFVFFERYPAPTEFPLPVLLITRANRGFGQIEARQVVMHSFIIEDMGDVPLDKTRWVIDPELTSLTNSLHQHYAGGKAELYHP